MSAAPAVKFSMNEAILYPEGKHLFQVVDYKPATGQYGPQVVWSFELIDFEREDGKPPRINYYTGTAFSLKSKLGKFYLACRIPLPQDAAEAAAMDPNAPIGKQLYGTIVHKMGSDGQTYSNIAEDSLLPVPKTKAAAPAPVSAQASPAAAVTAEEDQKLAAIRELLPILAALQDTLEERKERLTAENTGPGLKKLGVAMKAQGVGLTEIDYALISLAQIGQAKAEAMVLLEKLQSAAEDGEEIDPFAITGDVEK
jgi:hypothetical protein